MLAECQSLSPQAFAALRTELADLACELERQGRCDAADVVMILDARLLDLADDDQPQPATGSIAGAYRGAPPGLFP